MRTKKSAPETAAAPPTGAAPPATDPMEVRLIMRASLRPSPTNPRKSFPDSMIAERAASIAAIGITTPLLVRPMPLDTAGTAALAEDAGGSRTSYEIVDGECRYRAASTLEMLVLPCIVRELTDAQVLEIQLTSFDQRQDLQPLERAEAYQRFLTEHGMKLEDVAGRIGKSVSTLRGILRLLQLPEKARQALAAGMLNPSVAQALARIPAGECQDGAVKYALKAGHDDELPSYRYVRSYIERECMVKLQDAPFERKALDLVEGAGSCDGCPKRAGNLVKEEPQAWKGVRADVCTDPQCYRAKARAHIAQQTLTLTDKGMQVLDEGTSAKIFYPSGDLHHDCAWIDLDRDCWRAANGKAPPTYRKLIGKNLEAGDIVRAFDPRGYAHDLVACTLADKLLKEQGIGGGNGRSGAAAGTPEYKKELARKRQIAAEERATADHLLDQADYFARATSKADKAAATKLQALLAIVARRQLQCLGSMAREHLYRTYAAMGKTSYEKLAWLEGQLEELDAESLLIFLARCLTALFLDTPAAGKERQLVYGALRLDVGKAREAARAAAKAKKAKH